MSTYKYVRIVHAAILFFYLDCVSIVDSASTGCDVLLDCYLGSKSKDTAMWLNEQMRCNCITPQNPYGTDKCDCPGILNASLCCTPRMRILFTMQPQDLSECAPGLEKMTENMREVCSYDTMNPKCILSPSIKQCKRINSELGMTIRILFIIFSCFIIFRFKLDPLKDGYIQLKNTLDSPEKTKYNPAI